MSRTRRIRRAKTRKRCRDTWGITTLPARCLRGPTGKYAVKNRFKLVIALLFALIAVSVLAVPWYSSRALDAQIKAWAAQPGQGVWQLHKVAHRAGLFASSGSAELQFRPRCTSGADQAPLALALAYRVSHVPARSGWGQFTWTLAPSGAHSAAALPGFAGLSASGVVGYDGAVSSDVVLPALTWGADLQEIRMAASKARLRLDGQAAALHWNVDDMEFKAKDAAWKLQGARLSLALDDVQGATGSVALEVDDARTGTVTMQGLTLRNELREASKRWNYQHSATVRSLQWMGRTLSDVALQAQVTGLHAKIAFWPDLRLRRCQRAANGAGAPGAQNAADDRLFCGHPQFESARCRLQC